MSKRWSLFIAAVTVCIAGCSPEITKYYDSHVFEPRLEDPAPLRSGPVRVTAFSLPVETSQKKITLLDLDGKGQAAFVEGMSQRLGGEAGVKSLAEALAYSIKRPSTTARLEDRTRFKRRLVLSIDNDLMLPANRMYRADLTVKLKDDSEFLGWDKLATQYETIDLGKLTFTQHQKFTLGVQLEPPQVAELASVTAGYEAYRQLVEEVNLRRRYRVMSGALTPQEAKLVHEGVRGIDLTGNVVIDFEIDVRREAGEFFASMPNLFGADGKPTPADEVIVGKTWVKFVDAADKSVRADVRLDYVLREVLDGADTYGESDDKVRFLRGYTELPKDAELIPSKLMKESWCCIVSRSRTDQMLMIGTDDPEQPETLFFDEPHEARDLIKWLNETYVKKEGANEATLEEKAQGKGQKETGVTVAGRKLYLGWDKEDEKYKEASASDLPELDLVFDSNWE